MQNTLVIVHYFSKYSLNQFAITVTLFIFKNRLVAVCV